MNQDEIRAKWEELHRNSESRSVLPPVIRDSWERCYQYDVNPRMREIPYICSREELVVSLDQSYPLIETSLPVMNEIIRLVSGTGFVALLANADLCVLKVVGDEKSVQFAQNANLTAGSLWTEEMTGTAAGPLALALAQPVSVFAYEHFCLFSHIVASFAAPVFYEGKMIGGIGLVAPYYRATQHTLALVAAAAKHIESTMLANHLREYHKAMLESMSDGIIAIDSQGIVTYINKRCKNMFMMAERSSHGMRISDLVPYNRQNQHFFDVINREKKVIDETITLNIHDERIECNITCDPLLHSDPVYGGKLIILTERKRIQRIVSNFVGSAAKMTFDDIIGSSPNFKQTIERARTVASSASNVLLLGESGTGKDVIAQAIHNNSQRKNYPFIAINCAALPKELISSELFGYEDGAFTGAKKGGNMGKFELADRGTLFLDEIGEMPLDLQASLLRVIEEKQIIRLGGNKLIPVDVRIIAATNKDLERQVERHRFRRDLYYRLAIIKLNMPPLRERPQDIMLLARYFSEKICKRFGRDCIEINPEVIDAFKKYSWPGNVREMQNILEGSIQFAPDSVITLDLVDEYLLSALDKEAFSGEPVYEQEISVKSAEHLEDLKKDIILETLKANGFNKTETARILGISRRTLYRRLKDYGLI